MIETLAMAGSIVALVAVCILAYANDLKNRGREEEKDDD